MLTKTDAVVLSVWKRDDCRAAIRLIPTDGGQLMERIRGMLQYQETELKLRLADDSKAGQIPEDPLLAGMRLPDSFKDSQIDTTYYDTPGRSLLINGLTLRVRDTGETTVATVKDAGTPNSGLYVRGEWNKILGDDALSADTFAEFPIGERLCRAIGTDALEPIFKTRFQRISEELIDDCGSVIELAVDRGEVVSGDRREPFCEVELELKSGKIASLCKLGAVLGERYPLTVERKSKYARGLLLSGIGELQPETQAKIPAGGTVREVMGEILIGKIQGVFLLVEQFLAEPGEPESAHKCRVRIRQMRALLSFTKPVLNRQPYDHIQDRLRALADKFSYIREIDVMLEQWLPVQSAHPELAQKSKLAEVLTNERKGEEEKLLLYLGSFFTTPILLHIWTLLLEGVWSDRAETPLEEFAPQRLKKWTKEMKTRLKAITFRDPKETHALRILGKKIRYVQSALFPEDAGGVPAGFASLRQLQDLLGQIHDADRNREILGGLKKKYRQLSMQYESGLLIGYQMRESEELIAKIRRKKPDGQKV